MKEKSHSHIPAPMTVHPHDEHEHEHEHASHDEHDARPPASMVEDKRWEMPCTD